MDAVTSDIFLFEGFRLDRRGGLFRLVGQLSLRFPSSLRERGHITLHFLNADAAAAKIELAPIWSLCNNINYEISFM